jgi:hypothetical protein
MRAARQLVVRQSRSQAGRCFQPAWATGRNLARLKTLFADPERGIHSINEDDDEKLARLATIPADTDRLQICATPAARPIDLGCGFL